MSNGNVDKNNNLEQIIELIQSGVQKGYITSEQMTKFTNAMEDNNKNSKSEKVVFRFLEEGGDELKREELFQNLIKAMNDTKSRNDMKEKLKGLNGEKLYEWMELLWNISGMVGK